MLFTYKGGPLRVSDEEKDNWTHVHIEGVEVIPAWIFSYLWNLVKVTMDNQVRRIESGAFWGCCNLQEIQWSSNVEYIGVEALGHLNSLMSIFIPPSCKEIDNNAMSLSLNLTILKVHPNVNLGESVIYRTKLLDISSLHYDYDGNTSINNWIKNQHANFPLHHICADYEPTLRQISMLITRKGVDILHQRDEIGLLPMDYLRANPYANWISEMDIVQYHVLSMLNQFEDYQ